MLVPHFPGLVHGTHILTLSQFLPLVSSLLLSLGITEFIAPMIPESLVSIILQRVFHLLSTPNRKLCGDQVLYVILI